MMRGTICSWSESGNRIAFWRLACCGAFCLVLGSAAAQEPSASGVGPADAFFSLEQRLLAAESMRFEFRATAEGVVEADLQGVLAIGPGREVRLAASGTFGGQPVDLLLRSSGNRLEFGNGTGLTQMAVPAALKEALVIGVTRMGILHNLARLTGGAAPDHAEGGVREWVTVGAFAADADAADADTADADTLAFDLTVAGQPAGSATLEIDSAGRPMLRRQTVEFSDGQMRVVERYSSFTIVE